MLPYRHKNQDIETLLKEYLPLAAVKEACEMIHSYGVYLIITKSRKRMQGSYYRPLKNHPHRITINNDLNPYVFLITFLHEFAHLYAWEYHRYLNHGPIWKQHFSVLLMKFINDNVFPDDIKAALLEHMKHIRASDSSDIPLTKTLQAYNKKSIIENDITLLSDIPIQTTFIYNKRTYLKEKLLRKCFLCKELKTNKMYRFYPFAKVISPSENN